MPQSSSAAASSSAPAPIILDVFIVANHSCRGEAGKPPVSSVGGARHVVCPGLTGSFRPLSVRPSIGFAEFGAPAL
jgi:hypothetical protein